MWSPDRRSAAPPPPLFRIAAAMGLALAMSGVAACTVQPLYGSRGFSDATQGAARGTDADALPPIALAAPITRQGQEVRNQLLFLLNGGGPQPADPLYTVTLNVIAVDQSSATIQVSRDEEPTAAQIVMSSTYVITDAKTLLPVTQGRREILSSYDVPRQEFAVSRARRDAENRAARELAELLRLAIAQDLIKVKNKPPVAAAAAVPATTAPAVVAPATASGVNAAGAPARP